MLYEKALSSNEIKYPEENYTYTETKISISRKQFKNWVNILNESEFWSSPPEINEYGDVAMDNPYFFLDANTFSKYNMVGKSTYDTDDTKFAKACQQLVNMAGLGKEIQIARLTIRRIKAFA